jgi:hypothetical protein
MPRQRDRAERLGSQHIELERHMRAARRALNNARAVDVVGLDESHKELLAHSIAAVRDALTLVDRKHLAAGHSSETSS